MEPVTDPNLDILNLDQIDVSNSQIAQHPTQNCLVGKLLPNKTVNPFAIMEIMKKAWKTKKGMDAQEWTSNLFLFRFNDGNDLKWVIKHQPWHFNGHIFLKQHLESQEQPSKVQISEVHIWTRLYDAPVSCMNLAIAKILARKIGNFICADPSMDLFGKFIRVKIGVDVRKLLKKGIHVVVGGEKLWVQAKYESLPPFCFHCGLMGHSFKYCDSLNHLEDFDPLKFSFGPDIKASPLKKFHQACQVKAFLYILIRILNL